MEDDSTLADVLPDVELRPFPELLLATTARGVERDGVMAPLNADGVFNDDDDDVDGDDVKSD